MKFTRDSGILLHPSSLPSRHGCGDFGIGAYDFIDWLHQSAQNYWQVLPLVAVGDNSSPYTSTSAFAGNIYLINLDFLAQKNYLEVSDIIPIDEFANSTWQIDFSAVRQWKDEKLKIASDNFFSQQQVNDFANYQEFCTKEKYWLDDYTLFTALYNHFQQDWNFWPDNYANLDNETLQIARTKFAEEINYHKFCQWCFFSQWHKIYEYAHAHQIKIIGDIPIYVSMNSADVWVNQKLFKLDKNHQPTVVAGVPPDYYAVEGQRWGNPIYNWQENENEGYRWWISRLQKTFELVDVIRIDHFLGFTRYWEIPASEPTAINGTWEDGPKSNFFSAIKAALFPDKQIMPIIAEDLGITNPESSALREKFAFPGMRVLQFAWGSGDDNIHLPHHHSENSVVFTGTHDNDTIIGWYQQSKDWERGHLHNYLQYFDIEQEKINWRLIRCCMESQAVLAIFPLQDILGLTSEHRMNTPGIAQGNWGWRFNFNQITPEITKQLKELTLVNKR